VLTYQANNITSQSKRSVASATCIIGGGVGGILASVAFKSNESPTYTVSARIPLTLAPSYTKLHRSARLTYHKTGVFTTLACSIVSVILISIMTVYFYTVNKKAKRGERVIEGMTDWYYTY